MSRALGGSVKRYLIFLLSIPLTAGVLPDRYIVELSGESAAAYLARTITASERHAALLGVIGQNARAAVRLRQAPVRRRLERRGVRILGSLDTLANVLFVEIPERRGPGLLSVRGVRRVLPERTYRLTLDHALPLHKVPDAWNLGGAYPQGAGIKIGMIDTGIDITQPGFNDTGFQAPPGFPVVSSASDFVYTNQKVIVARSYVSQCLGTDPDTSARDDQGHGTGTAMTAAGVQNTGPLAIITGVAPLAYLGNYKVFGSTGFNDDTNSCAIDAALEDAVNDGMEVINLSLGGVPAPPIAQDEEVGVVENAIAMGVIVTISAGNVGPGPSTIGSPGTSPDAITAGAMNNDRYFAAPVTVGSNGPYPAIPGDETLPTNPITAPMVDISTKLDPTGLACNALPAGSLSGDIAFILRGTCLFQDKLNNAQAAGAIGALVYTEASSPDAVIMDVGTATLPAEMVSNQDGVTIKGFLAQSVQASLSFSQAPFSIDPNTVAAFSSRGPSVDFSIKPDILAVGENIYVATETVNDTGELYDASGYVLSAGTSYSAPLMAGAAAVLKAARPGFTPYEYKSLLVNSAAAAFPSPDQAQSVQNAGAGYLDLSSAMLSNLAVNPALLGFGTGAGSIQLPLPLRLSNIGYGPDTFQISVSPTANAPSPTLSTNSLQLDSDTYSDVTVTFKASGLAAGEYEGVLVIQATNSGAMARVPYWYAVPSNTPGYISILDQPLTPPDPASSVQVIFSVTDSSGIPISGVTPKVTISSGGGSVRSVGEFGPGYPGVWVANLQMGAVAGSNVFLITAGPVTQTITIVTG